MNTDNNKDLDAEKQLESFAEETEKKMEQRDAARLEAQRDEQQDLNQGMQTGTHDAKFTGVPWGSSYSLKKHSSETKPEDKAPAEGSEDKK